MEKKRCNTPSNPVVGQYPGVWAHLFTFLKVEERCRSRRVCSWFKRVLETPGAWRSVAVDSTLTSQVDDELVRLGRKVPVEVSVFEVCDDTLDSAPVREWGCAQLLTAKLRELAIKDDQGHSTTHDWIKMRNWEPCYTGLTTLTLPWCMALENRVMLVQLQGLRSLTWTRSTSTFTPLICLTKHHC